jgi:hypothetical protein
MERLAGIAALTAEALGRSEEAAFFVVADGGGVEAGADGEFTDFHFSFHSRSEEKLRGRNDAAPPQGIPRAAIFDVKYSLT